MIFKMAHSATNITKKINSDNKSLELVALQETPHGIAIVRKLILLGQRYDQGTSYGQGAVYGIDPVRCHIHQE